MERKIDPVIRVRPRFNINGDLWYDVLNSVRLLSYDYSYTTERWTALGRVYKDDQPPSFIIYQMDDKDIFDAVEVLTGRESRIVTAYKKRYKIKPETRFHAVPRPPKLGEPVWRKGMTRGQWEAANGPGAIEEHMMSVADMKKKQQEGKL